MLLFVAYDKQSGHVYATSGESQLNVEGQICHCSNEEILCLWLLMHSVVGPVIKKDANVLWILFCITY
jgi:hypothetical protein